MVGDIIFYGSLVGCIMLGSSYKQIDDINMKRNYGAGLGLLVACMIGGHHVIHSVLIVWGNIFIIKCCDKSYLHHVSLCFTWIYLVYLHFYLKGVPYLQMMYKTMALRLVGLAFEVHLAARQNSTLKMAKTSLMSVSKMGQSLSGGSNVTEITETDQNIPKRIEFKQNSALEFDPLTKEPTAVDIIAYSYFFIGLHAGPYYRWKIFDDHFKSPFAILGDCRVITEQKVKKALICCFGYLLLRMKYAPEVYYDDAFYKTYDNDFRYLYSLPQLVMYFLRFQMIMMLSTSVCTETGFGVYPAKCMPVPGHGPTAGTSLLKLASTKADVALEQEYNFSVLKCFENERILFGPRMKDTLRGWDMPTRYWFWTFIYKNSIKESKVMRNALSFLAWLCWAGPSLQYIIIAFTMWIYLKIEAEYQALFDTDSSDLRGPWRIGYSIMRLLCLIYLTPCLIVQDSSVILKYYNSIWWSFHIILFCLMVGAASVSKSRDIRLKRSTGTSGNDDARCAWWGGKSPTGGSIVGPGGSLVGPGGSSGGPDGSSGLGPGKCGHPRLSASENLETRSINTRPDLDVKRDQYATNIR